MGSCSKVKASLNGEEDRISNLPDGIISRILSFLPTKHAVLTSVLSSRWKHHWRTIDRFHFDNDLIHILCRLKQVNEIPGGSLGFLESILQKFEVPNIQKFKLSWDHHVDLNYLRAFIILSVSRNVQELELDIRYGQAVGFPPDFYVCNSLTKLKFKADYLFNVPQLMEYFPSLKSLHVQCKKPDFPYLNFCKKLLCRCPKLEELFIDMRTSFTGNLVYEISGATIKRLMLIVHDKSDHGNRHIFKVAAPKLEYLCIMDETSQLSLLGSFPQLKKAIIDLRNIEIFQRTPQQFDRATQILNGVANTKFLSLSLAATNVFFDILSGGLPSLPNLACLEVTIHDFVVRQMLSYFLKISDNLEVLILQMENNDEGSQYSQPLNWRKWDCIKDFPICFLQQLKVIRIKSFRGEFVEIDVIKFLLSHSKVLQRMTIHTAEPSINYEYPRLPTSVALKSFDNRILHY